MSETEAKKKAVQAVIDALAELSDEDRKLVLKSAWVFFDLGKGKQITAG